MDYDMLSTSDRIGRGERPKGSHCLVETLKECQDVIRIDSPTRSHDVRKIFPSHHMSTA